MYIGWADHRGMRFQAAAEQNGLRYSVTGLAAYALLSNENGLHVLETPAGERDFDRIAVRVTVKPVPLYYAALPAGTEPTASGEIVRRYRFQPSPSCATNVGGEPGRADRVLAGDFDLFG